MLHDLLLNQRILICCGCGGVGKTTTSAALGIRAASLGKKVIVLTIDPAKRLADSLGIGSLTNEPKKVELPFEFSGQMWAMMLDVKQTLETIIEQNASSEQQIQKIRNNHIYQQLSQNLGGAHEYGAMERLYQIYSEGDYDLIVLDTPPSQNALDFIMAPLNLKEFFSQSVFKFFILGSVDVKSPSFRWTRRGKNLALKIFEKLTGSYFLKDLSDFLSHFHGMYEVFKEQADCVSRLLASPDTAFLIITSPQQQHLRESELLYHKFQEFRLSLRGLIINKCTPNFSTQISSNISSILQTELQYLAVQNARQSEYEQQVLDRFLSPHFKTMLVHKIPTFSRDVYNLETLVQFSKYL